MQTLKIDRSRYTLSPTRDAGAFAEKLRKCTGKTKLSPIKSERRVYPKFSAGDSTAEYVHRYWVANGFSDDHRKFFAPLNTEPATLYSGEDTHETIDDFELCAPVESIQTAPDDIAQPEPAPVSTAPVDSPEPVTTAPDAPMDPAAVDRMAAALLARFGVSDPAACAHLASFPDEFERIKRESIEAAADQARETATNVRHVTSDEFDAIPARMAAASARHAAAREAMRAPGTLADKLARASAAHGEPVDTAQAAPEPGEDPAPVDVDTMRAARIEPAPALEFVSRWTGAKCNGLSEVTARIECARRQKAESGFVFKVAPCLGEGLAPWQATAMRGKFEVQRWRAVDPVPGDSDPVPVNSAAPVDPDEAQPGETGGAWFERIRRESAEKRARIEALADRVAAGSGSIGFTHPRDPERFGIAGPDMSGRGAFRFSCFDAAGAISDAIRETMADAIAAGVEYGFTVDAAPLEWPDNPAPAPVPVPVNSADVDAVEVARLVAVFREYASRQNPSMSAADQIRAQAVVARGRADNLTALDEFHDAPGTIHAAAKAHYTKRAAEYRAAAVRLDAIAAETDAAAITGFPVERPDRVSTTAAVDMRGPVYRAHVKTAAKARELEGLPSFKPGAYTVNADPAGGPFETFRLLRQYRAPVGNELRRRTAAAMRADRNAARVCAAPDAAPVATHSAPIAEPVRYCIHRLRRVHDEINATRATTTTARGRRWVRIMNALRSLMSEHPERRAPVPADTAPNDDTTPAPLDGLDVIETADADTLAEFDRLSRAPGVAPPATDARPIPSGPVLRIPAGDLRARIPARFAPAYLLTA